jgi:hypothetical protein
MDFIAKGSIFMIKKDHEYRISVYPEGSGVEIRELDAKYHPNNATHLIFTPFLFDDYPFGEKTYNQVINWLKELKVI